MAAGVPNLDTPAHEGPRDASIRWEPKVVYRASGARSAGVRSILRGNGFTRV
jgi:rhodanese-related sulfurtransferase